MRLPTLQLTAIVAAAVLAAPGISRAAAAAVPSRAVAHYLRARLAVEAGEVPAALAEMQSALVHDEQSASLHVAYADVLVAAGSPRRAEAELRRALELEPEGAVAVRAHLLAGRIAAAEGRRERAIAELRHAARLEAASARREQRRPEPLAWRMLAAVLAEAGDLAGAAAALDELADAVPGAAAAGHLELARSAEEAGEEPRAERHLRRATALAPGDGRAWHSLAALEERRGRRSEARAAWEAAARADPDDLDALLALGRLALRDRDLPAARAWFAQRIGADPDADGARSAVAFAWLDGGDAREALTALRGADDGDARVALVRGAALQDLRRWEDAASAFARIPADGGDLDRLARVREAWCLSRAGRHDAALQVLSRDERPRDPRWLKTKADVLARGGRAAEAVALLEGALAARPTEDAAELAEALGGVLFESGRPGDAIAVLERALAERPQDAGLLFALASAHERAGDVDAGVERMRMLLAVEPDHPDALNFVAYAYAERGVRLDEAERMLSRALELRPDNPYFLDSLGWVYFRRGEYDRAVQVLERADQIIGPDPTVLEHLGDAYLGAGRPGAAAAAYERAVEALRGELSAPVPPPGERRAGLERKIRELSAR